MVTYEGAGSASETDPFTTGITIDLTPEGGFVSQAMVMDYTCSGNSLEMTGTLDGQRALGPWVFTS